MSSKNDGLKEKLVFITAIVIKELQSGVKSHKHLRSLMPSGHYNYSMGDALDLLCEMDFIKEVEIEVPHENSSIIGYELKTKEDIEKKEMSGKRIKNFSIH